MASAHSRKRRRSVAFESPSPEPTNTDVKPMEDSDDEEAEADKGAEVWDAFREEYYEVLEQLPLTLQRSFALMRELDEQSTVHNRELLQKLLKYIEFRKSLCNPDASQLLQPKEEELQFVEGQTQTPGPATPHQHKPPSSSPALLSQIAWLAEEVVRASDEKVNVAKTAYESADRQIRFLDFAIQEQETSLTLGLRPGTNPLHTLCGSVVSRYIRPPIEGGAEQIAQDEGMPTLGVVDPDNTERAPMVSAIRRRKKGTGTGRRKVAGAGRTSLKLTVPPLASVGLQALELEANPNEPRYCYCNMISYGEMIACDNDKCQNEWFHLGCTGLSKPPKGTWFCRSCQELMRPARNRKGR